MAEYRNKTTGDVHTDAHIKDNNPNISFSNIGGISQGMLSHLEYETVFESSPPSASSVLKVVVRDGVEQKDNKWWTKWVEKDRHTEYTNEDGDTVTKSTQDTAYQTELDNAQKNSLRGIRKPLLEEADWSIHKLEDAGSDTSGWKTYRQQLRDITKASDIYNVTWPTKP